MKRLATMMFVAIGTLLFAHSAGAAPSPVNLPRLMSIINAGGTIVIPPEWDGIYTTTDSTYDCLGNLQDVSTDSDTLCAGAPVVDPNEIGPEFSCTGGADANSVDVTCTGSYVDPKTGCTIDNSWNLRGTRSGGNFFVVVTTTLTFSGPFPCDLAPDQCSQTNIHAVWQEAAPPAYCMTPAQSRTWGQLKLLYR